MDVKGAKMVSGDFAPEGRITQHLKDVHLMQEQAERIGQQLPALAVHADVLEACVRPRRGRPRQLRHHPGDRPAARMMNDGAVSPLPPPLWGRVGERGSCCRANCRQQWRPPPLTPPHKGEGNGEASGVKKKE